MKAARTAAIVIGVGALIATGVGAAVGAGLIGGVAAGAAAGTAATFAGVTAATFTSVAAIAGAASGILSMAAGAAAPKGTLGGNPTKFKIDKEAGIPIVIGRTFSGGNVVHRQFYDRPGSKMKNQLESWVAIHSLGPVKSLGPLQVDKAPISFSGGAALGSYAGNMWLASQLGACPEPAAMSGPFGFFPGWTTSSKLSGLAADIWTLDFDSKNEKFPNGVPERGRVVEGMFVYDARQDSTFPGGSGPCRLGNEATYVYSENPGPHAVTWAFGRYQNGVLMAGGGLPAGGIDIATFVEWSNICDANGWKVGGQIFTQSDDAYDVLTMICQAGAAEPASSGAQQSLVYSAPRVSIGTITSNDIAGTIDVPGTATRRKRRNTIIPKVRLESHGWEVVPLDAVSVPDYVTIDKGRRPREVAFPLIQQANQGAQVALYGMLNDREIDGIVIPAKVYALGWRPNDCITLQVPEANLIGRPVIVRQREIDSSSMGVALTCRTDDPAKHPFALGKTGTPPATPDLSNPGIDRTAPSADDWDALGGTIEADGVAVPAIVITGDGIGLSADEVLFEYRVYVPGAGPDVGWSGASIEPVTTTRKVITSVAASTEYQVGIRYRTRGATSARLILGPVLTGAYEGVKGSDGASAFTLTPANLSTANIEISGGRVARKGGTGWTTGQFYTRELRAGGCEVSFIADETLPYAVVGLHRGTIDPNNVGDSHLLYAWHTTPSGNNNDLQIYEGDGDGGNFTYQGNFGQIVRPVVLTIRYDNRDVVYLRDGQPVRTVANVGPGLIFRAKGHLFSAAYIDSFTWSAAGAAGSPGLDAPLVRTQWSINGIDNWHDSYFGADQFYRQSNDNGVTWGAAIKGVAENGTTGADGSSATHVFRRSATVPSTPGTDTGNPPPGWSDGPPPGEDFLWLSKATYRAGSQLTDWTTPQRISGADAQTITLSADRQVASYNAAGAYAGGSIAFTAIRQNIPGSGTSFAIYRVSDGVLLYSDTSDNFGEGYEGGFDGSGGDKLVVTALLVAGIIANHGAFRVEAYRDGYVSRASVSIAQVRDGAPGLSAPLVRTQWSINGIDGWHDSYFGADQFYRQSNDNGATWGAAIKGVAENGAVGADGSSATHVFRRSATVPATPGTGAGNPPPGWSDGPPAGTDFLWLSKATYRAGSQLTDWSAPQRISGEKGDQGASGITAPRPVQIGSGTSTGDQVLLGNNQAVALGARVRSLGVAGGGSATIQIQIAPAGSGAWVVVASGSADFGPSEPYVVSANGTYTNTGIERLFDIRVVANAPGASDPARSYLRYA